MNNELITVIIKAVIMILSVLITSVIIPYVKGKIGESKYDELTYFVKYAVRCAEQIYTPDQWKEKKEYVTTFIINKAKEININLSEEDIDILIEGIVNEIKHNYKEAK